MSQTLPDPSSFCRAHRDVRAPEPKLPKLTWANKGHLPGQQERPKNA
jgi:hypothetical protein